MSHKQAVVATSKGTFVIDLLPEVAPHHVGYFIKLAREGAYGPYLALAEACELNSALVGSLAASLQIEADTVNATHLAALAWTNGIGIS